MAIRLLFKFTFYIRFICFVNIKNFDLNLLRVLHALGETGSTVRAAEQLHLSQPAVSSALRRLREALGDPLFERSGQGLSSTSYCQSLLPDVAAVIEQIEQVLHTETTFLPQQTKRTFRLAASDYFADFLMPVMASQFERLAPNARLQMTPLVAHDHLESLERFQTDAMLFLSSPVPGWMRAQDVMVSHFRVIARRGSPDLIRAGVKPGERISMDLYCGMNHALYSPSGQIQTWVDEALASRGRRRQISVTMQTFHSLARTVSQTSHLATVPALTARELAKIYPLDVYQHPLVEAASNIMLAWHYRNDQKPHHRWFRELVVEAVSRLRP